MVPVADVLKSTIEKWPAPNCNVRVTSKTDLKNHIISKHKTNGPVGSLLNKRDVKVTKIQLSPISVNGSIKHWTIFGKYSSGSSSTKTEHEAEMNVANNTKKRRVSVTNCEGENL